MKAIEINGEIKLFSKYPKNFKHDGLIWALLDDKQATKIGFKDVVTPTYDSRIEELSTIKLDGDVYTYDVVEIPIKETLTQLKDSKINELKSITSAELSLTDWYIVRNSDTGAEVPQSIKEERADIRTKSDSIEAEINALTTKKSVVLFEINL
jgi:hypothetical protein